jgi:5-hydroxyisourate hydrolase-like protein (transthyretin family)
MMRTANGKNGGVTKLDLETVRTRLEEIFSTNKIVHVSVNSGRTKLIDIPSTITGIYNHFFCVTAHIKNYQEESFTINFIDIIIGKFKIKELTEIVEIEE